MVASLSRRAVLGASAAAPALAAGSATAAGVRSPIEGTQPFAEHHLALQISDRDAHKQALVLSVANNVLKAYGPDLIAIEVVAFGPGIDLLLANSPHREAVDSLIAQGVRFDVCMNTVDTITRQTGRTPGLNDKAIPVDTGVAQLLELVENGFTLVRP